MVVGGSCIMGSVITHELHTWMWNGPTLHTTLLLIIGPMESKRLEILTVAQ